MTVPIRLADLRHDAEQARHNGPGLLATLAMEAGEVLALVEAVEAVRHFHQPREFSPGCALCSALARFDFEAEA